MPSATSPEPPLPWREFLREVDASLAEPITLHCLGGFVATVRYGLARATADVDYVEILPFDQLSALQRLAGPAPPSPRSMASTSSTSPSRASLKSTATG